MIMAAALAGVVAYGVKFGTGRVRPSVKMEKVWQGPDWHPNNQAFPSGHSAVSAGFFGVLLFVSWRIGLLCFAIPLFVGFTRIFLGAHFISDVVAGILVGLLAAAIVATFLLRKDEQPS
jgi:undecaprenyl-diphosphatase